MALFHLCAAFPEDATVPTDVIDCLEATLAQKVADYPSARAESGQPPPPACARDALEVLLSYSLLQGSLKAYTKDRMASMQRLAMDNEELLEFLKENYELEIDVDDMFGAPRRWGRLAWQLGVRWMSGRCLRCR